MKIDFNSPVTSQDIVDRNGKQASTTVASTGPSVTSLTEDRATLSTTVAPTGPSATGVSGDTGTSSNTVIPTGPTATSFTEDRATLSNTHTPVQSIVTQALQSPPVRQQKVDALRQQIASGEYKADPGKIAEGIIAESAS